MFSQQSNRSGHPLANEPSRGSCAVAGGRLLTAEGSRCWTSSSLLCFPGLQPAVQAARLHTPLGNRLEHAWEVLQWRFPLIHWPPPQQAWSWRRRTVHSPLPRLLHPHNAGRCESRAGSPLISLQTRYVHPSRESLIHARLQKTPLCFCSEDLVLTFTKPVVLHRGLRTL